MGKTLIVKVGSEEMGWIPSKKYYDEIEQKLIDSGVLKNFDGHIVTHWATNFEVVDTDTMQVQKSEPETEILKDEKYCKCESIETVKDMKKIPEINEIFGKQITINEQSIPFAEVYLMKSRDNKEVTNKMLVEGIIKILYGVQAV